MTNKLQEIDMPYSQDMVIIWFSYVYYGMLSFEHHLKWHIQDMNNIWDEIGAMFHALHIWIISQDSCQTCLIVSVRVNVSLQILYTNAYFLTKHTIGWQLTYNVTEQLRALVRVMEGVQSLRMDARAGRVPHTSHTHVAHVLHTRVWQVPNTCFMCV